MIFLNSTLLGSGWIRPSSVAQGLGTMTSRCNSSDVVIDGAADIDRPAVYHGV
jgi:hypothetical protein